MEATDADLLRAFRAGDAGAFRELVERHQGQLLRHASMLLGYGGGAAEDAVQEALLTLARTPPDPDNDIALEMGIGAWLHRVTRNQCLDTMRAETRRRDREGTRAQETGTTQTGSRVDPALEAVDATDTQALIERTLSGLPEDQREAVTLRLLHDKSYAEIATITGRKVGTVGWLISRGMKSLAAQLSPILEA